MLYARCSEVINCRPCLKSINMSKRTISSYFQPVSAKRVKGDGSADDSTPANITQGTGSHNGPQTKMPSVHKIIATPNGGDALILEPSINTDVTNGSSAEHTSRADDPEGPQLPLAVSRQVNANRNQARARLAVTESTKDGKLPELQQLMTESSWNEVLSDQFKMPYWKQLQVFVHGEWKASGSTIYPPKDCVFRAFNSCPFNGVRVVILGQDPYFNPGEAMGLSFSVPKGVKVPSSLQNIYKELASDLGCSKPSHGDLQKWAQQGVFLMNATLTVKGGKAGSHQKKGWERFTDAAITALSKQRKGLVFLLWGKWAQQKRQLIDLSTHHVLESAHPSGLSASRGFFGCKHFSQANQLLEKEALQPIDWQIE